ncbi:hypothetical protein C0992_002597 [Termitomyces sp. T32_za158]|nr:hypothetical protein C0992_002597 [Termitomyces sp. T32_za158]
MPPKRKASSSDLSHSPTKRLTRSIVRCESAGTTGRITRSSGKLIETPSTPIRTAQVTKTYGKSGCTRRLALDVESSKENEELQQASSRGEQPEMSDDELDMLSPSKTLMERLDKQPRPGSSAEAITFTITTRSRKQPETPVRKPTKRGRTVPAPRFETPQSEDEVISLNGRSKKPTATVSQVERRTSPQVITSRRASTRKKPLVATSGSNVEYTSVRSNGLRGSSSRRGNNPKTRGHTKQTMYGTQDDSSPPSKTINSSGNSSFISSEAPIECFFNQDASRSTTPTVSPIFDGVVLPSVATPFKPRSSPKATSTRSTPDSLSDKPTTTRPLDRTHSVGLRTPSPPDSELTKPTPISTPFPLILKRKAMINPSLPAHIPRVLPNHLHTCLAAQKKAILQAIQQSPEVVNSGCDNENESPSTNKVASQQLTDLLSGTINRGEGNSCLILGPRGSGKSRLIEQCISSFSDYNPLVIRLSGWTQHSDRLAMREIARQLSQQTGNSFPEQGTDELEDVGADAKATTAVHLPSLISLLPTFNRPTVIILDGFDVFALHPRQALLYCLLDTAQSCRVTAGTKGLAVIGVTSRNDTIVHLEKRVKSRFSGRMIRTAPPCTLQGWQSIMKVILTWKNEELLADPTLEEGSAVEWHDIWTLVVEQFIHDSEVQNVWNETFAITRDVRMLTRILVGHRQFATCRLANQRSYQLSVVLRLSPSSFSLSASQLTSAAAVQRKKSDKQIALPYPSICLLIASVHAYTTGQQAFTFEMLYEFFRDQVRASTSAPVQLRGGSIGMVRCSRQVLMTVSLIITSLQQSYRITQAFENLVAIRAFVPVVAYAQSIAKEFIKYRSVIEREDIKKAVERVGQVNLKKWLTKATQ